MFKAGRFIRFLSVFALLGAATYYIVVSQNTELDGVAPKSIGVSFPYDFLDLEANTISFHSGSTMGNKYSELIGAILSGDEQLRILHIGDSHIQADIQTGHTRRLLSTWLNDNNTSRGFTFPYQVAGTNSPHDYRIEWNGQWKSERITQVLKPAKLGVSGIAITTNDPESSVSIALRRGKGNSSFDLVTLYFEEDSANKVIPYPTIASTVTRRENGSITYKLPSPFDSLTILLTPGVSGENPFRFFGMELNNSLARVVYHAAGVNGAAACTYLLSENFVQGVASLDPHVIILSLGTNDTYGKPFYSNEFENHLAELVLSFRRAQPDAIVILTTPGDHLSNDKQPNPSLALAQVAIHNVASTMDCGVWDFYRVMGGAGSINLWAESGLSAADRIHLSPSGYRLKGELLFYAMAKLSGLDHSAYSNLIEMQK